MKRVTIPRLELAAAELLSQLCTAVKRAMEWEGAETYLWSDSTIALQWINRQIHELKIFVANRVKRIHETSRVQEWNHVRTHENPADLISRGLLAAEMVHNELWWHGPAWLKQPSANWPEQVNFKAIELPPECRFEMKTFNATVKRVNLQIHQRSVSDEITSVDLIDYSNNLDKVLRILSYVFRFCKNARSKEHKKPSRPLDLKRVNELVDLPSKIETVAALNYLVKIEQRDSYPNEYKALLENARLREENRFINLPERSKLSSLRPRFDEK